jgi:hypothetical protein
MRAGPLKYASAVIHVMAIDLTVNTGEFASRTFCFIVGVLLFFAMLLSLMRTIIVPRALRSFFSGMVMATVVGISWALARTRRHYRGRDAHVSSSRDCLSSGTSSSPS